MMEITVFCVEFCELRNLREDRGLIVIIKMKQPNRIVVLSLVNLVIRLGVTSPGWEIFPPPKGLTKPRVNIVYIIKMS